MTVNAPDFDPTLNGHAAVEIENVVHAVVSKSRGKRIGKAATACVSKR